MTRVSTGTGWPFAPRSGLGPGEPAWSAEAGADYASVEELPRATATWRTRDRASFRGGISTSQVGFRCALWITPAGGLVDHAQTGGTG